MYCVVEYELTVVAVVAIVVSVAVIVVAAVGAAVGNMDGAVVTGAAVTGAVRGVVVWWWPFTLRDCSYAVRLSTQRSRMIHPERSSSVLMLLSQTLTLFSLASLHWPAALCNRVRGRTLPAISSSSHHLLSTHIAHAHAHTGIDRRSRLPRDLTCVVHRAHTKRTHCCTLHPGVTCGERHGQTGDLCRSRGVSWPSPTSTQ